MKRIQRKRTKGWKMPPNTKSVTRPGKWGNPFDPHRYADPAECLADYRRHLDRSITNGELILEDLSRYDALACWCPVGSPCHADILVEVVNERFKEAGEDPDETSATRAPGAGLFVQQSAAELWTPGMNDPGSDTFYLICTPSPFGAVSTLGYESRPARFLQPCGTIPACFEDWDGTSYVVLDPKVDPPLHYHLVKWLYFVPCPVFSWEPIGAADHITRAQALLWSGSTPEERADGGLEDVLSSYAVEKDPGRETLKKYLSVFPRFADELIDLSFELAKPTAEDLAPLSAEDRAKIDAAWQAHQKARGGWEAEQFNLGYADGYQAVRDCAAEVANLPPSQRALRSFFVKAESRRRYIVGFIEGSVEGSTGNAATTTQEGGCR